MWPPLTHPNPSPLHEITAQNKDSGNKIFCSETLRRWGGIIDMPGKNRSKEEQSPKEEKPYQSIS